MTENRTERTPLLGLLALMQSPAGGGPGSAAQGWGFPYWNQRYLDALIAALHEAPRTGVALLTAPPSAPTVAISATSGYLPAGLDLEVCQTWTDEWGRETDAGPVGSVYTGDPIPDPDTAPTLGAPYSSGVGFDGGLLEVAYSWIDEAAGETTAGPVARVDVPYRAGGLQSEVLVTLPAAPASVGAAGAFIYARHRSGNWVRAAAISDPAETEVTLDGSWISCFVSLPLANSTGSGIAFDITGIAAPDDAYRTRFYLRVQGETWSDGDRRLRIGGVDEWDPAGVTYPLVYTGAQAELAPGYPPPVSQMKAIRKVDAETEIDGVLAEANLDPDNIFTGTEKADRLLSALDKTALTDGGETELHRHPGGLGGASLALQLALSMLIDRDYLVAAYKALRDAQFREVLTMIQLVDTYPSLQSDLLPFRAAIDTFASAALSADGVIFGLVGTNGGGTTLAYSAGAALVGGAEYLDIKAGDVALTNNATNYVYVHTDETLKAATAGWPETRHAKVCTAVVAAGAIGTITNTVKVSQSAYDGANDQLKGAVSVKTYAFQSGTQEDNENFVTDTRWRADSLVGKGNHHYYAKARVRFPAAAAGKVMRFRICPDNGGKPDLGATMATVDFTDTSGGSGLPYWAELDFGELNLTNGATYWSVLSMTTAHTAYIKINATVPGHDIWTDDGATWNSGGNMDSIWACWCIAPGETVWQSKILASGLTSPITRLLGTLRGVAVDDASAWDDAKYAAVLEVRTAAGGSWQTVANDKELIPVGANNQLEMRCRLTSLDATHYPVVDGLGVVWEA